MKRALAFGSTLLLLAAVWGYNQNRPVALEEPAKVLHLYHKQIPAGSVRASSQPKSFSLRTSSDSNDTFQSGEGVALTVEAVSDLDVAANLNALITNSEANAAELRQGLIRRWAEADPASAGAWAAELPAGPVHQEALQQVILAWAEVDLSAARQWLVALPDDDGKRAALISLAYEAARTDPVMALQIVGTLPASRERDDALVHATSQWASMDLQAALAWAGEVPDPGLRQRLIATIATASAKSDGAGAAGMVANLMVPGDEQNRAAVAVVQRWAQAAPQAAIDWVSLYPDGPVRAAAVRSLMELQIAQQSGQDATKAQQGLPQTVP